MAPRAAGGGSGSVITAPAEPSRRRCTLVNRPVAPSRRKTAIESAPLPMDQWGELVFREAFLDAIARREGIGDLLAKGSRALGAAFARLVTSGQVTIETGFGLSEVATDGDRLLLVAGAGGDVFQRGLVQPGHHGLALVILLEPGNPARAVAFPQHLTLGSSDSHAVNDRSRLLCLVPISPSTGRQLLGGFPVNIHAERRKPRHVRQHNVGGKITEMGAG